MKYKIIFFLISFCYCNLQAQIYPVSSFQKINDINGGFNISLDQEDWFGHAVEGIGDLNGDGIGDVAVSALQDDDGAFNIGAIYILFLNEDGTVNGYQKISANEGGFNGNLEEWDYFGRSISFLGDINGDGFIEVAIGAEYDGDGGYRHGAIYIISLNTDGTVFSSQKISDTIGGFEGNLDTWDVFGSDIAILGDLNGDGTKDIAVGARRDGDGGDERGAVYILFLSPDFTVNDYQKISATQGNFDVELDYKDYFGGSVTNIGDLNGDGVIDIAVGAYRDDDGGDNKGAVYILFLNSDGTVNSHQKISETQGNLNEILDVNSLFGVSTDLIIDLNGDGKIELIVGCGNYGGSVPNIGFFYILNLNSDGTVNDLVKYSEGLQNFNGDLSENDYFGHSVSYINEFINKNSIIIGAFGDSEGGFQKGSAWILQLGGILSIEIIEDSNHIFVFPNPSKNAFSLSDNKDVKTIQIFDMYGRQVVSYSDIERNYFSVAYLPVGEYIIYVSNINGNSSSYKLIKE